MGKKHFLVKAAICILFICYSIDLIGQNLSVSETVSYLNNHFNNSVSEYSRYSIKILDNNQIVITKQNLSVMDQGRVDEIKFNPSDIDLLKIYITDKFETCDGTTYDNIGSTHITLHCKNNSKCIYDPNPRMTEKYTCMLDLYLDISSNDLEKVKNALLYLIRTLKNINQNSPKDNDPFAPNNFNKQNQTQNNKPSSSTSSPCNIKTINRSDGTTVQYFNPEYIGKGSNFELGMAAQSNGENYFLSTTVRYLNTAKKVMGKLQLHLSGNQALSLNLYRTEITSINNENVGLGMYYLTNDDILKLKNYDLLKVVFQEADGKFQIVVINDYQKVVQRQINCLTK